MAPEKLSADAIEAMGKKELLEALHAIAPIAFLSERKLAGNVANVAKKAKKPDVEKAYEELFKAGTFATAEERAAEQLEIDMKKASLAEEKAAAAAAAKADEPADAPEDDGPPKFEKVTNKAGNKQNYPKKGDKVKLNYTGKFVNGDIFDSNCDVAWCKANKRKPSPLCFKIGSNQVIKGWEEGVKLMSVGESATLTIEPEWAYGRKGQPQAGIGPDCTLVFEVELLALL